MNNDGVPPPTAVLSDELRHRLRDFIARRVREEADVEDLVQEIMLRISDGIATVKAPERLDGWIYRIARNAIIDYYRRGARREVAVGAAVDVESAHTIQDQMESEEDEQAEREIARCLTPLLTRLTPPHREAIELVAFQRIPQRAAAERLGVPVPTMKSRVQRGRQQLRELLLDCCAIELDARHHVRHYETRTGCGCNKC